MGAVTAPVRRPWTTISAIAAAAVVLAVLTFLIGHSTKPSANGSPSSVDIGFSQDMASHHDQAVLMANLAITRGGAAVQSIADSILTVQSQEIGQLRGWLQLWHEPAADAHPMSWMATGGADAMPDMQAGATMPGMASATELATLYSLTGKRFDVLFLQLMIRHHQGGIEMAHYAETHARLTSVRSAATGMRVEQAQDIAFMEPLLASDGGKQLQAP
jgi:uncharacterized protein (DUF305 family)